MIEKTRVVNVVMEDVFAWDYPDLCDAFIAKAEYLEEDGTRREISEEELTDLNEDFEFVHGHAVDTFC